MEPAGGAKGAKGRKSWNPRGPYLGKHVFGLFFTNLHQKLDLTNAFKSFFRDDSFEPCSNIAGSLGKSLDPREAALGVRGGARAREAKGHKAWNLPRTLKKPLVRSGGKSLAQGQVALIDLI